MLWQLPLKLNNCSCFWIYFESYLYLARLYSHAFNIAYLKHSNLESIFLIGIIQFFYEAMMVLECIFLLLYVMGCNNKLLFLRIYSQKKVKKINCDFTLCTNTGFTYMHFNFLLKCKIKFKTIKIHTYELSNHCFHERLQLYRY